MKPIRILHENVIMDPGGIETQLMRIYRNIDRSKVQFDFLVHREHKGAYDDEITSLGGKIFYTAPFNPFYYNRYMDSMRKVFDENPNYKIIVVHSELALGPLKVATEKNIPVRICFSHNNQNRINIKRFFLEYEKFFLKKYCTEMFAVSDIAAQYTFGKKTVNDKKVRLIKNGMIIDDFIFDIKKRMEKRQDLNLENKIIVGHIGRFMDQKNHIFLLEIFKELLKIRENAHLILIGEGKLENKIKNKIKSLKIEDNVSILGRRMDVGDLMSAMDIFVFPSFYEGFGNVAMEAQAAALPILMTDTISDEVIFSDFAYKMPLNAGAKKWAIKIDNILKKSAPRIDMSDVVAMAGYDIRKNAKWYENFYLDLYNKLNK